MYCELDTPDGSLERNVAGHKDSGSSAIFVGRLSVHDSREVEIGEYSSTQTAYHQLPSH